jgi:hypothetical protein
MFIYVLFRDGKQGWYLRHDIRGMAFIGEPTVFVIRDRERVNVRPGESVNWIEA